MEPIHHRMPVILGPDARDAWLGGDASEGELMELLVPYAGDDFEAYEVSQMVNSPRNDRPECTLAVA
jgi:putative SOS response-associated peptidase YedK